jgi:hypothetical protein
MIAIARPTSEKPVVPAWHEPFLVMLPAIVRHASISFTDHPYQTRKELVQEAVANCLVAYVRLVELGKQDIAYPTVLAMYAVRQIREGRRVGTKMNVKDVSSTYCQLTKGVQLKRLDHFDHDSAEWMEIVVEDGQATPADIAATRIDFAAWLDTLPRRERRIAEELATGETTNIAANKFNVSAGRISQLRRRLMKSWDSFQHGSRPELSMA